MLAPSILDRKSTRLNSSHTVISYAVFCLKKKKTCTAIFGLLDLLMRIVLVTSGSRAASFTRDAHAKYTFAFFFNDTATTESYTLSLHDALPISSPSATSAKAAPAPPVAISRRGWNGARSEAHTSELQSHSDLVCRLLLEKKKTSVDRLYLALRIRSRASVPTIL